MATRLKPSRINVDNTPRVGEGASYKTDDDFHWSMGGGDMAYEDFAWQTLTGSSVTIEKISNNITPSSDFTVAAGTVKPGITYTLRVNVGNTPYTMTLGTGVTNPNGYATTLEANTVSQFRFIATSDSQLELELVDSSIKVELDQKLDHLVILSYGNSTWSDFINAYNKNAIVYCRASSNSNPATGAQNRLAFMAYVNNATTPTEVEFQYYRSRSSHSTAQNQQDEVYVYKLTNTNGGTWTVEVRDTAARIATGTGLTNSYTTSSGITTMTIANDGVLTVNGVKGTVTVNDIKQSATAPSNPTAGTAWYDTTNGALKVYNGSAWETIATGGSISDTAYGSGWDGQTTTAPSQNAVYDKIESVEGEISTNTSAISTINGKIPSEATTSNQLADKEYVLNNINSVTAYYITKNAQGDQFATYAELAAATTFYSGGVVRVPTRNDYTIVLSDENHDNATTRYIYNSGWEYQYTINETPLTQAQLNALNSGITAAKVTTYDGYATSKQDKLVNQTNIKSINNNSLLGSGNLTLNDVKVSATAPSNPTEGMVWYDTTNDQLKVHDGTSWQLVLNEGDYIDISNRDSRQGPCPDGFIVPSSTEFASIKDAGLTLGAWTSSSFENMKKYLKIPPNSYYKYDGTQDGVPSSKTSYAYIRFRNRYSTNNSLFYRLQLSNSIYSIGSGMSKSSAFPIRPLKITPVVPDSNWTTLFDGSSVATNAGIFWNPTLGLISISADGTTWYTIKDKNIGANKVYDYDNMILAEFNSEAVVGKLFQGGNNYPFPYDSINSIKLSSTQIDGTQFGPSQYYSPIFITSSAYNVTWDNPANGDLRGNVSGIIKNAINNIGVKTINAKTGHVEIEEYTAGKGIQIIKEDYSAMRGPLPEFFHVGTRDDLNKLYAYLTTLGLTTGSDFKAAIKLPSAGNIRASDLVIESRGSYGEIISAVSNGDISIYRISISNNSIYNQTSPGNKSAGYNIRGFYDLKVAPDSTWTTLVDGSSIATGAGVFHNPTLGLISVSGDGINWITIADKNCGATTVWNDGDTLSEANCGKYYQRGNNYGFPFNATGITTSSTKVDASAYGPGNYYSSSTFILADTSGYTRAWDNPVNKNLWGGETGKKILEKSSINNTGVTSINGQTGDVTFSGGITKVFTLASTSDLTTAQEAYDWIVDGGNAMIILTGTAYVFQLFKINTTSVSFAAVENFGANNPPLRLYVGGISFTISSGTVTGITNVGNQIRISSTVPTSGNNSTVTLVI